MEIIGKILDYESQNILFLIEELNNYYFKLILVQFWFFKYYTFFNNEDKDW